MNRGEFLDLLTKFAQDYRERAVASVSRNKHMNELGGQCDLSQDEVDALLTDFINFIGVTQGVDYGLYASDLKKKLRDET